MGVDTGSRIATLAGFNVGIEIGQFLFVGLLAIVLGLLRRSGRAWVVTNVPRFASIIAALLGSALFIQRVAFS